MCLPEYRTCKDGSTVWQIKNHRYDATHPTGGVGRTYSLTSPMFNGKTVESLTDTRIIETDCDGTISLTIGPDNMEMLHVYNAAPDPIVCILDAPSLIHPMGEKSFDVAVAFDCLDQVGLTLNFAFMELGDNGNGVSDEVYQLVRMDVADFGTTNFYIWIPDANQADSDYISTPDGGQYIFRAWLADAASNVMAQAVPVDTTLKWGISPLQPLPTDIRQGENFNISVEWEDLYEYLDWQGTPLARNDAFPARVAIFRSSKTEARYPGHFDQVNDVCRWLDSMGYSNSNPLDISFDNVVVSNLYIDNFNDGNMDGWTRAAGCANWHVVEGALRVNCIGNDDNIVVAGHSVWSNYSVAAAIRYNQQGPYFNDAEIYLRYQNRDNFIKVGIRNFYGFWRLKYTVRVETNNVQQDWIYNFLKTNSPVENTWYNLRVDAVDTNFTVYFDGVEICSFSTTNFPAGKIALGSKAQQLGIYDPRKGYYFIDDDEYAYYSEKEGEIVTLGKPLNLDYGYLATFYPTLILPGTYVMSDIEASNVVTWLDMGRNSLIATDGGVAMKNETGADDPGRLEDLFGVDVGVVSLSDLSAFTVGSAGHYVTLDYESGDQVVVASDAMAWNSLNGATALGAITDGEVTVPALIIHSITNDPVVPKKVVCFNFAVDSAGQLTHAFAQVARRAFEWARGQAYKVSVELVYGGEFPVATAEGWILGSSGSNNLTVSIPDNGIMSGTNFSWGMYVYPWDSQLPWADNAGFYTSGNDGTDVAIDGKGLQIFGGATEVYGGRAWDMFGGWNTLGESNTVTYGVKKKGELNVHDGFNDGDYNGWTVYPVSNTQWAVTGDVLRATSAPNGGYGFLVKDDLDIAGANITIEYDVLFEGDVAGGGLIYGGHILYLNPDGVWWSSDNPLDFSSSSNFSGLVTNGDGSASYIITGGFSVHTGLSGPTTGEWHNVLVNIHYANPEWLSDIYLDGDPLLLSQPLSTNAFTTNTIGFLSVYTNGYMEVDNFRVTDERYSSASMAVNGVAVPTNATPTWMPWVPDYEAEWVDYRGTALGGEYEYYAFFKGEDNYAQEDIELYFSPRLMVESPGFPREVEAGTGCTVPVSWNNLETVPMMLQLTLVEPYIGQTYAQVECRITNVSGTAFFDVEVSEGAPASENYFWTAFFYATNSSNPLVERLGLDDTFRFDSSGLPFGGEIKVTITRELSMTIDEFIFGDWGFYEDCSLQIWGGSGSAWDSEYMAYSPPEGWKCFRTDAISGGGWGLSDDHGYDFSSYLQGMLVFWVKSDVDLCVGIVANGITNTLDISGYGWVNGAAWNVISIPMDDFGFEAVDLTSVTMPFFVETVNAVDATFLVDDIRWAYESVMVFADCGIPLASDILVWSHGESGIFDGAYVGVPPPEGTKSMLASNSSWFGWGVFATNSSYDLSAYSNGVLTFWLQSDDLTALKVEVQSAGTSYRRDISGNNWTNWQLIAFPVEEFGMTASDLEMINAPFMISTPDANGGTFLVDDVKWLTSCSITNPTPRYMVHLAYEDGVDLFPQAQAEQAHFTGAACCWMVATYLNGGSFSMSQQQIHADNITDPAHNNEITPYSCSQWMDRSIPSGYRFASFSAGTLQNALRGTVYWMDYLPAGGMKSPVYLVSGTNWNYIAARGFEADRKVYGNYYDFTVYGLWLNDPRVTGLGYNYYATAEEMENIFYPSDANGVYYYVAEPPGDAIMAAEMAELEDVHVGLAPAYADADMAVFLNALFSKESSRQMKSFNSIPVRGFDNQYAAGSGNLLAVIPSTLRGDAGFMELFNIAESTNYYIVNEGQADAYVLAAGGMRGPGSTLYLLKMNPTNAALQRAAWDGSTSLFPPVSRVAAEWLARKERGLGRAGEGVSLERADFVYDAKKDATPFMPRWQLTFNDNGTSLVVEVAQNADLSGDEDGDGMSDGAELYAGSNPSDIDSLFTTTAQYNTTDGGDEVVITWMSVSNKFYSLYHVADLQTGFTGIASHLPATPPVNSYTDRVDCAISFYRLEVE